MIHYPQVCWSCERRCMAWMEKMVGHDYDWNEEEPGCEVTWRFFLLEELVS